MVTRAIPTVLGIVILLATIVSLADAQNASRNEVALLLGAAVTPSQRVVGRADSIDFGTGVAFQGTYARRITDLPATALYFELPVIASPLVDLSSSNSSVPANYALLFITPGIRLKFAPSSPLSPWFSVGGGYALFEESKERQDGGAIPRVNASRGAVQFGGGIDFRTPIKLLVPIGFRAEIRDFYSGKPELHVSAGAGFQHNLVISGGFVLHF